MLAQAKNMCYNDIVTYVSDTEASLFCKGDALLAQKNPTILLKEIGIMAYLEGLQYKLKLKITFVSIQKINNENDIIKLDICVK